MKTYLVTGAAGFIGANYIKYILAKHNDIKVVILDALTYAGNLGTIAKDIDNERCVFIKGDICSRDVVDGLFAEYRFDYVVNFAAESHVDRSIENPQLFLITNILGTQNLLDCARRAWVMGKDEQGYPTWRKGVRYHQVSTDEVYGSLGAEGYFTEATPLCPHSPYSASKTSADMVVMAYHDTYKMPVTITRCSNNYGPYHFPEKLIPLIIKNILEGKHLPVYGDGSNVRDWLYVEGAVDIIYRTLQKTGLIHDEGPDKDGGCGPYVQSERQAQGIYLKYAKELIDKGEAYYCFCDKERLEGLKKVVAGKEIHVYDKHCLHLSKEEVEEKLAAGVPYVIRQNNPTEGTTTFEDEIYGDITVDNAELDDMILIKSDGYPTYNFANVVDDHLMGITHVVRGNEYLSSSPKYNRLYEAFGWEVPVYIHCPLITDENHQKLSKRCGHSSFEDLVEQGFLTEAIVNFVALLGWSPADNQEIMTLEELVEKFDYHHMNKSPAVFDYTKLKWMNGEYIKKMDFDKFYEMALPYIKEVITKDYDLKKIAHMVQTRIEIFPDIRDHIDFFEELPEYDVAMYTHKKMKTNAQTSLEVLQEILPVLEAQEDYSNNALYQTLLKYVEQKGCKNGYVMWPIRTAVSGKQMTPGGATELMEVLGKEESLARIRKGIELLSQAQ